MTGIDAFLAAEGWGAARRRPVAADASARSYLRLLRADGARAVLAIVPPELRAAQAQFARLAAHLRATGLHAPQVLAADDGAGLMLMEDLGETRLADLLPAPPEAEAAYALAARLLGDLAAAPVPAGLDMPDARGLVAMVDVTLDRLPDPPASLRPALEAALEAACARGRALSLRDVHGENLVWRAGERGAARLGWLDFQDAVILPLGYDLASLVDDVRHDVPEGVRQAALAAHAEALGWPPARLEAQVATLSLLRNLRILGLFDRLAAAGKPRYRAFLPRARALVARAAAHPDLSALAAPVAAILAQCAAWEDRAA